MVHAVPDMEAALDRTAELVSAAHPRPIFEATFLHENVLIRADILTPDGDDGWSAIDVKASTRVKGYQMARPLDPGLGDARRRRQSFACGDPSPCPALQSAPA
jgi:hypothetical protein